MSQAGIISTSGGGGGGTPVETITGNTGVATPVANNINLVTANTTVKFVGSGSSITQDFGLSNLLIGAPGVHITSGTENTGLGDGALSSLTSGEQNTGIGTGSLVFLTSASFNTCLGSGAGGFINTGFGNTFLGYAGGSGVTAGSFNTCVGYSSGSALNPGDSSNILISADGLGENSGSNRVYIGHQGSGNGQQNTCHIAGITGTIPINANHPQLVVCDNLANLTVVSSGTSGFILTSNGNAAPTFQAASANLLGTANQITVTPSGATTTLSLPATITAPGSLTTTTTLTATTLFKASAGQQVSLTTPGAYPYTTLVTDYLVLVDSSVARTIVPMSAPATGQTYRIKDNAGTAAANNITVTPSGKNIDGAASYVLNTNYGAIDIVYNGTQWNVL